MWWQLPSYTTASGVTRVVKDQTKTPGQWVSLGQFNLNPATAKVSLLDYGVSGKRVYADAVRFIPLNSGVSTALYYVHADHLGTPRQLTTSTAANTTVWRWSGEPFGSALADSDPDRNGSAVRFNLRFPGQYFDAETKLHYNYFRDYDPSLGRYIESDPIGLEGGLNTYGYVGGNPVGAIDPKGLLSTAACANPANAAACAAAGITPPRMVPPLAPSIPSEKEMECPRSCPPCTPYAAGTVGYIGPHTDHSHYPFEDHVNLWVVNQNPKTCKCFWNKRNPDAAASPQPGWIDLNNGFPPLSP